MKMSKYAYIAIFIAMVIFSCGKDTADDNAKVFTIEDSDFKDWNSFLKIKEEVRLQGNDSSCIITYCDKCIVDSGYMYFWDHKAKVIYRFSADGKFVCKIGERGRALSEYIEIKDMQVDKQASVLKVLDDRGILNYRLQDGKFIGRTNFFSSIPAEYDRFAIIGKDSFLCFTDIRNKFSIVLDTPAGQEGLRESKRFHLVTNCFYTYDGRCRVVSDYGEFYIDEYADGKLTTLYKFDLGNKQLPGNVLPQTLEEFNVVDNDPTYFKCITDVYETSSWLYALFVGPEQTYYHAFINKNSGKYVFGKNLDVVIIGADETYFYALVYPGYISPESDIWNIVKSKPNEDNEDPIFIRFSINENKV